jgi:NADPH-dependent ferric siderophore reductase
MVWCHRRQGHVGFGMLAAQAVRDLTLPTPPAGRGACWVGLEATAMRAVRRYLLDEHGMDRQQLYTQGYWKLGHDPAPHSRGGAGFIGPPGMVMRETAAARLLTPNLR